VIGVSRDRLRAQRRFVESSCLPFPMLCDESGSVVRAYGVRGFLGLAKRVSFLIDPEGVVRKVYTRVSPRTHAGEVLEDLRRISGPD
jgi:peroxiredoxin Q/BCP